MAYIVMAIVCALMRMLPHLYSYGLYSYGHRVRVDAHVAAPEQEEAITIKAITIKFIMI